MKLQDRIAKRLLREELPAVKLAGSWETNLDEFGEDSSVEYRRAVMAFGPDQGVKVTCMVADDMDMQIEGLQKHAEIGAYEGMLFPYDEPRTATFHMGTVKFPIDMVFVGSDGRVNKIVENIEPGSPGRWGMGRVSSVIEVNGGFCAAHGIEVGTPVTELSEKTAQAKLTPAFINTRTGQIVVSPGFHNIDVLSLDQRLELDGENSPWDAGFIDERGKYYTRDQAAQTGHRVAQETFPRYPRPDLNRKMVPVNEDPNRFRDRDLVDQQVKNQPMSPHHEEQWGYDPVNIDPDDENIVPTRPAP